MASYQPSPITPRKSPNSHSLYIAPSYNSTFISQSGLNDTLHSTQSLSGRSSIMTYKNKQYLSASAALTAYISDFEGAPPLSKEDHPLGETYHQLSKTDHQLSKTDHPLGKTYHQLSKTYHRTVEDLLTPRSVLLRTVDRSLDTGVRDTRAEWRRYVSKKLLDESYSEMVQDDLEREKAQSLIESTRHLTSDLSPLPGSSVINEMESEVSVSTDALLLAPPYPPRHKEFIPKGSHTLETETFRSSAHRKLEESRIQSDIRQGLAARMSQSEASPRRSLSEASPRRSQSEASPRLKPGLVPQFPSDISPVKELVTSSVERRNHLKDLQTKRSHIKDKAVQGWKGQNLYGASPRDKSNLRPRQKISTEGHRPPPSWIQDLEGSGITGLISGPHPGGRAPPSWIQELDASRLTSLPGGRAPPSWIQDLEASGISSHVKSKTQEQRNGGRPPPSWIQDLNSTLPSVIHGSNSTSRHPEYLATHKFGHGRMSTQKRNPLIRSNSASDLITSDVFHDVTTTSQPPGLTVRDFEYSEQSLGKKRLLEDSKQVPTTRTVKFSENAKPKKTYSFTTDDLILASPTGKGFDKSNHNVGGRYSPNTFSNKYSHSNSGHYRTENNKFGASKRSFGATQELFHQEVSSAQGDAMDFSASTPKHSVGFDPNFARRSMNGYTNEELSSQSRGGYSVESETRKMRRLFAEDDRKREDALLERAQKVLNAARASRSKPSHFLPSHHHHLEEADRQEDTDRHDNSLLTEEILDGDRPWERKLPSHNLVSSAPDSSQDKPHHQHDIVAQFLEDCLRSASENQKLTGGSQPGPVEALKNMLFTLQGMDPDTQSVAIDADVASEKKEQTTSSLTDTSKASYSRSKNTEAITNTRKTVTDKDTASSSGSGTNFDEAPGGKSLQRAMEHLSRLKVLVNGGNHQHSHQSSTNAHILSS